MSEATMSDTWESFTYDVDDITYTARRRWLREPPPIGSGAVVRIWKRECVLAADNVWEETILEWEPA